MCLSILLGCGSDNANEGNGGGLSAGAGAAGKGSFGTGATAGTGGAKMDAGSGGVGARGGGVAPMAGDVSKACVKAGGTCATNAACCDSSICVQNICAADCSNDADCLSGCCLELSSGQSVCAPTDLCPPVDAPDCAPNGGACSSKACCGGVLCFEGVCSADCSANSDCANACCYMASSGDKWCAPNNLCSAPVAPLPPITTACATTTQPTAAVIESRIYEEFEGWTGETVFKLDNGQYWKQASYAYTYHYAYRPRVQIVRESSVYRLHVDGVAGAITVELVTAVADTTITSDFDGWNGDTIFQLENGQVWQQAAYAYVYNYAFRPDALIYCDASHFAMQVEGVDSHVQVKRIK